MDVFETQWQERKNIDFIDFLLPMCICNYMQEWTNVMCISVCRYTHVGACIVWARIYMSMDVNVISVLWHMVQTIPHKCHDATQPHCNIQCIH